MKRYFVECRAPYDDLILQVYVRAYSESQVFDILSEYEIVTCDITMASCLSEAIRIRDAFNEYLLSRS